jgi:hypothetical protein
VLAHPASPIGIIKAGKVSVDWWRLAHALGLGQPLSLPKLIIGESPILQTGSLSQLGLGQSKHVLLFGVHLRNL